MNFKNFIEVEIFSVSGKHIYDENDSTSLSIINIDYIVSITQTTHNHTKIVTTENEFIARDSYESVLSKLARK